jgi:hypothetical protein
MNCNKVNRITHSMETENCETSGVTKIWFWFTQPLLEMQLHLVVDLRPMRLTTTKKINE